MSWFAGFNQVLPPVFLSFCSLRSLSADNPIQAPLWICGLSLGIDFAPFRDLVHLMTATLEQTQSDLQRLVNLVQQGEEVVIISQGQAVARLTAVPRATPSPDRQAWLAKLRRLRE